MFKYIQKDLPAGITVFLVAVPLCLGIAVASGAEPISGIIAGIVGGTIVAIISKSPLGVSGPAAGLAIIVLEAIKDIQNPENADPLSFSDAFSIFLTAVVIGGLLQMLLGFLKAGIIGYYFPNSVIKGMLAGIGFTIFVKQIPHAVGYDKDPEGDLGFTQVDGHNTASELYYMLDEISYAAILITVVSLAILILWERPFMKKTRFAQLMPAPLLVVALGILSTILFKGTEWAMTNEHLVQIPLASENGGLMGLLSFPNFSSEALLNPLVWKTGAVIAIVASLETLLCVEATDKLDPHKRITPTNRELVAQGAGNFVSGLIGGLPITQVIVRSSANIQSGGRTKMAAIIHGFMLLICVLAIPNVLNMVPYASLAAILFIVGYKLSKPALFKEMFQKGWTHFVPFAVTFGVLFGVDLLWGVGLGLAVAIFLILRNNYQAPFYYRMTEDEGIHHMELTEDVTFLNKANILKTLKELPNGIKIEIDASKALHVHPDVIDIIEDFKTQAKERNIELSLKGFENINSNGVVESSQTKLKSV